MLRIAICWLVMSAVVFAALVAIRRQNIGVLRDQGAYRLWEIFGPKLDRLDVLFGVTYVVVLVGGVVQGLWMLIGGVSW